MQELMEKISTYFATIPDADRTLLLVGALVFFWMLEAVVPLMSIRYKKFKHALPNLFFTLTTAIINFAFALVIVTASDYMVKHSLGLVQWITLPPFVFLLLSLLALDLIGAYLVHWVEHQIPWMWRFHVIHHSDSKVDSTTALRHHPGESVFRAVFTLLAVVLTGAPMWVVMVYQSLSALMSQFNHANINIGRGLDKLLSFIIVTPGMHRVHHHAKLPLTDTNYGNIFSIWDRLFGTYAWAPAQDLQLGLDVFDQDESKLADLLKLPFNGRSYRGGKK